jgi:hypothetical protein
MMYMGGLQYQIATLLMTYEPKKKKTYHKSIWAKMGHVQGILFARIVSKWLNKKFLANFYKKSF